MKGIKIEDRSALLAVFSMVLAIMSLSAAFYQSYIYTRQLDVIQRNVSRGEYIRACRDVIEAYFQVKLRVGLVLTDRDRETSAAAARSPHETEAANAVSHLGALGTYLANFQNDDIRYRYTLLTRELSRIVVEAPQSSERDPDKLFAKADELFAGMNNDCVRSARAAPL